MKHPGDFTRKVWELAMSIPKGRVTTYGLLAVSAGGHPMLSRMITSILSKCPNEAQIPYHRIVYANGLVWLDPEHKQERLKLYKQEGIKLDKNNRIINFDRLVYTFD
ncbi:MAG: MGMT family protein [Candidatus Shapirobacteria bacterium]|jgi:methylated-DNA-protein-cysteine methyltransferase-like protein